LEGSIRRLGVLFRGMFYPTIDRRERDSIELLLRIFPEEFLAYALGGFGTILDLKSTGSFQLVEMLHDEIGDVEFEAGAFDLQPLHAGLLFAQADDQADDFAIKAGRDLGHVHNLHGAVDEHGDDGVLDGLGVAAGHDDFLGGFGLLGEVAFGGRDPARLVELDEHGAADAFDAGCLGCEQTDEIVGIGRSENSE
jgi:hypothetical protein